MWMNGNRNKGLNNVLLRIVIKGSERVIIDEAALNVSRNLEEISIL